MPELPEVEAACILIREHCLNKRITRVEARELGQGPRHGQFDDIIITSPEDELIASLSGSTLVDVRRKGKQIWLMLRRPTQVSASAEFSLLMHFGMTGSLVVQDIKAFRYKDFKVHDSVWPPKFTKLLLEFVDDLEGKQNRKNSSINIRSVPLAFTDPRRLGRIRLVDAPDPQLFEPVSLLAPDPLTEGFQRQMFIDSLAKIKAPLKAVLLDQNRVVCGIGNWLADEVCYRAGILPNTPCESMPPDCVSAVFDSIVSVVAEACQCIKQEKMLNCFPEHWLFHFRWRIGPNGSGSMGDGSRIVMSTVAGRTTAVVPSIQKSTKTWTRPKDLALAETVRLDFHNGVLQVKSWISEKNEAVEHVETVKKSASTARAKGKQMTKPGNGGPDALSTEDVKLPKHLRTRSKANQATSNTNHPVRAAEFSGSRKRKTSPVEIRKEEAEVGLAPLPKRRRVSNVVPQPPVPKAEPKSKQKRQRV